MVFLQAAARKKGPAASCFRLLETGAIVLFVSEPILSEVGEVLARPEVRKKNPALTDETVEALLERVLHDAILMSDVPKAFIFERDPDDEPYINLAIAAGAKYLVSRDKDLLDLMNDLDFRARFAELTILDPVGFLQAISSKPPPVQPT
jgi:putative PIN family toxin of toxin-antitoxin system